MISAPSAEHVVTLFCTPFVMATSLAHSELLSAVSSSTGVIVVLVIGMLADFTKSACTRTCRHPTLLS